jgi:hypothetical protein
VLGCWRWEVWGGVFVTLVRAVGINPVKKGQPDEFFGVAARD